MKSTFQRATILLAALITASMAFSCTPRLVGEKKAKEAGLALINRAFDVNETDAEVTYAEYAGFSYVNGAIVQYGTEEPVRVYSVSIPQENSENPLYYAMVNAETGFAYHAEKSESLLSPMSAEQQKQAEELASIDVFSSEYDFSVDEYQKTLNESNPAGAAAEWVTEKFCPGEPTIATLENGSMSDSVIAPRVCLEYSIVFVDGAVYQVSISWPTMEIQMVSILSQNVQ